MIERRPIITEESLEFLRETLTLAKYRVLQGTYRQWANESKKDKAALDMIEAALDMLEEPEKKERIA